MLKKNLTKQNVQSVLAVGPRINKDIGFAKKNA